jgi:hypothetical protein
MTVTATPGTSASTGPPRLTGRDLVVLLAAAACLQALAWAIMLWLFSSGRMGYGLHELADTLTYQFYVVRFSMGQWPYAQVPVEYPPLANLVFLVAPGGGAVAEYERWFSTAMIAATTASAVLTTAAAAVAWRSLARGLAAAVAYAVLTLCCGALAVNRYDAVVAASVAAALLFLVLRRGLPAGVSLGLGFALKLTPALLAPLALVVQETRRRAVGVLLAFFVAACLPFVPFLLHDPGSVLFPFTYHAHRPLQIESVPATPWLLAAALGDARPAVVSSYGSQNLGGGAAGSIAAASPWLLLLAVAAVYALVWRRRHSLRAAPSLIPVAALAVLLAAVCTSKVLSPQFLIWTFPVVALVVAGRSRLARAAGIACMAATLLTQVEFPARYWRLVALDQGPLAIVAARNLILLLATALAVLAVTRIAVAPAPGSPEAPPPDSVGTPAAAITSRS